MFSFVETILTGIPHTKAAGFAYYIYHLNVPIWQIARFYLVTITNPCFFSFQIAKTDLANLERKKQALAKKADRNANDEDRSPPSLEDLKRRGIIPRLNMYCSPDPTTNFETTNLEVS